MDDQIRFPAIGDRVRVAIRYADGWRPLVWLRAGADGSIYVGLLLNAPDTARRASVAPEGGKVTFRYEDAETIPESELPPSSRVSFKASGEIHLGNELLRGRPLERLSRPVQLCLIRFIHPSRYREPAKKNANDYDVAIVGYPVDVGRPMYGAIFASPWPVDGQIARNTVGSMRFQNDVFLAFRGFQRTPDLALQIAIGHGIEGPWPPLPEIAVLAES